MDDDHLANHSPETTANGTNHIVSCSICMVVRVIIGVYRVNHRHEKDPVYIANLLFVTKYS